MSAGGEAIHTMEQVVWPAAVPADSQSVASLGLGGTLAMPAAADPALLPKTAGTGNLPLPGLLTVLAMLTDPPNLQHVHQHGGVVLPCVGFAAASCPCLCAQETHMSKTKSKSPSKCA
jgi:hypothetical protein